jgi:hypothetical protein
MAMSQMHTTCLPYLNRLDDLPLSIEKWCYAWMRVHPKKVAMFVTLVVGLIINASLVTAGPAHCNSGF